MKYLRCHVLQRTIWINAELLMSRKFLLNMWKIDQRIYPYMEIRWVGEENTWCRDWWELLDIQPSSDHSVAPWGGALLKSTICSSAAFRCASISRRALCHSLTQNPYTGVMCGLMVSPPHLKRKEDNMSQTFIQLFPKAHLRPDFLASPIYTIQEQMKVRNVLHDHSACWLK